MSTRYDTPEGAEELFQRGDFDQIGEAIANKYIHPEGVGSNSYVPKMNRASKPTATGLVLNDIKSLVVYTPAYTQFDPDLAVKVDCQYKFTCSPKFSADGRYLLKLSFPDLAPNGSYFPIEHVVSSAVSNKSGDTVFTSPVYGATSTTSSLHIEVRALDSDPTNMEVNVNFTYLAPNTNFGAGILFPKT